MERLQGIVLHILERSDNFLRLKRVKYGKAAKEISQAGLSLVSVELQLNLVKPSRSKAWSRLQWRTAKFTAMHTELGLWTAGAPPEGTTPPLTSSTCRHECRAATPLPPPTRSSPSAASSGQPSLRGKPARPPRAFALIRCTRQRREWSRTSPGPGSSGGSRFQALPAGSPTPEASAAASPGSASPHGAERGGSRAGGATVGSRLAPPRPVATAPPPGRAVARKRSRCRPEALPPRPSQDGGGHRNRAAVFRHIQAPERGAKYQYRRSSFSMRGLHQ